MPPTNLYVYVAGPLSGGDQFRNVQQSIIMADKLREAGFMPFVPHLCSFWHMSLPRTYEDWLEYDFAWLDMCDGLIRIPGESPGADREVSRARELGKHVWYTNSYCDIPIEMIRWRDRQHAERLDSKCDKS